MMVSVEWHSAALEDLADIYLHANGVERDRIQRAAHEIDQLLRVTPSTKGERVFAGQLSELILTHLFDRKGSIPEISRRIRFGPIVAYFADQEEDGRAIVWCLQLRT